MPKLKIGDSPRRAEDIRFITGGGCYVDDMRPPGLLQMAIVRSPHAHADIRGIETAAALAAPGVAAVLTGQDMAAAGIGPLQPYEQANIYSGEPFRFPAQYPLATGQVRYGGQPVAMVIAASREQALDAAEHVRRIFRLHATCV